MSESIKKNVVSLEDYGQIRRSMGSGPGSKALRILRDLATSSLERHIKTMMDGVDDALFSRAEKAENNMIQTQYFDAMRELRIIRKDIENDFLTQFKTHFDRGIPRPSSEAGLDIDGGSDLGLIDKNDLEEDLAVSNMVNKIRSQCLQSLYALDKRIGFLIGDADLEKFENPVGPEAICNAFRKAADRIETGLEIRLVIFKLFDKHIGVNVDSLYRELNQQLVKMDVLPEIRTTVRKSANPARHPGRAGQPGQPGNSAVTHGETGQTGNNFPGGVPGQAVMGGMQSQGYMQYVQPSISALTYLQQGSDPVDGAGFPVDIPVLDPALVQTGTVNILRNMRDTSIIQNLGKSGSMTLDIVAMLFDYILEDRNIPDAMRALIGRLQIPLLKVALLDNNFFSRKSHPARQLLNRLASTAVGWDESQGNDDPLYTMIESIVQTILDEFEDDLGLFETLLSDLDEFLAREEKQAEIRAERSAKVMEGTERVAVAESTTMKEIQPRIDADLNLDFVRDFVATHWKNLLFICCARHGKDSTEWKQSVQTMDELIWSVKPKTTPADRQKLVAMQPRLLEKLRLGMERLSIPPTERDDFIARLVHAHGRTAIQALEAEAPGHPEEQPANVEPVEPPEPVEEQPDDTGYESTHAIDDDFTDRARQLKAGTWVEFRDNDGQRIRAKLSWVSPITGTCLFTDRKGLKAGNYTIEELAHLLRSARARLLNAAPLMDRAVRIALKEYEKK